MHGYLSIKDLRKTTCPNIIGILKNIFVFFPWLIYVIDHSFYNTVSLK